MRFSASNCHGVWKDWIYYECLTAVLQHLGTGIGERAYKFSARTDILIEPFFFFHTFSWVPDFFLLHILQMHEYCILYASIDLFFQIATARYQELMTLAISYHDHTAQQWFSDGHFNRFQTTAQSLVDLQLNSNPNSTFLWDPPQLTYKLSEQTTFQTWPPAMQNRLDILDGTICSHKLEYWD